jgi:hypothetical protein
MLKRCDAVLTIRLPAREYEDFKKCTGDKSISQITRELIRDYVLKCKVEKLRSTNRYAFEDDLDTAFSELEALE